MFGVPMIVVYLIMSVIGVGVLWTAKASYDSTQQKIGASKVEQKYAPVIAVCDSLPAKPGLFSSGTVDPKDCAVTLRDGLTAIGANVTLQADLKEMLVQRQACNEAVTRIQNQGVRTRAFVEARKPSDDKRLAEIAPEKAALIEALGLPQSGTCEQRLAQRDALWAKVATQRQRDFPQTGEPPRSDAVIIKGPVK